MTEDQAIERIAQALADDRNETEGYISGHRNAWQAAQCRPEARVAWNEMKTITREDAKAALGMQRILRNEQGETLIGRSIAPTALDIDNDCAP